MFFSQDILQRRGGKFGIVWLAATKCTSVSLSRRDYFTVSISKTCDDIVKYISLEARPLKPHGARPRLSLYLSSQLMFGVARVYEKQTDYLSAEVRDFYMRFTTTKLALQTTEETDLYHKTKEFCTLQDPLIDSEDSEFGVLRFREGRALDPSKLPYIDFLQDLSPPLPLVMSPEHSISPYLSRTDEILHSSPHTVSSMSEISIKEIPEPPTLPVPGDLDLPILEEPVEDFMEQIQLAMGEESRLEVETEIADQLQPPRPESLVDGRDDKTKVSEPTVSPTLPSRPASPKVTPKSPVSRQLSRDKEAAIPPEPVTPTLPTPAPVLHLSPLLEPAAVPSPRRRGRRRQLLFSDAVDDFTQLSKQYIKNNMATSNNLCYTADEVLPSKPVETAKELLRLPARRSMTMSKTLMALWKSKAVPYKPDASIPSRDVRTWSTEYLRVRPDKESSSAAETTAEASPQVEVPRHEMLEASPEQLRDISVESARRSRFEETPTALTFSDVSRLSESRDSTQPSSFQMEPSAVRHRRRLTEQSIEEEATVHDDQMLMMGVPDDMPLLSEGPTETLQEIPEVTKSPEISTSEEEQLISVPHPNVIREIAELTAADETITFKDLVPVSASRINAGKVFSVCLEYAALKLIVIWQTYAYGDIFIKRGELF